MTTIHGYRVVDGKCPECDGSLFLTDTGYVACQRRGCADPFAPSKALRAFDKAESDSWPFPAHQWQAIGRFVEMKFRELYAEATGDIEPDPSVNSGAGDPSASAPVVGLGASVGDIEAHIRLDVGEAFGRLVDRASFHRRLLDLQLGHVSVREVEDEIMATIEAAREMPRG